MARLSKKQQAFVEHYTKHWSGTRAAREAGYDTTDRNTLSSIATENLRKPAIAEAIAEKLDKCAMRANEALSRLGDIARMNPADLADALRGKTAAEILLSADEMGVAYMIKGIKETAYGLQVEFHDPMKALELIGKHHALFREQVDVNLSAGGVMVVPGILDADAFAEAALKVNKKQAEQEAGGSEE